MSQSNKPRQGGPTGRPAFAKQSTPTSAKKAIPRVASPGPGHTGAGPSGSKPASTSGSSGSTSDPPAQSQGSSAPVHSGGSSGSKPATSGPTPGAVINPGSCASGSGSSCPKSGQTPANQSASAATNSGPPQSSPKPDPSVPTSVPTSKGGTENDPKLVAIVAQSGAINKAVDDTPASGPASMQGTSAATQSNQPPSSSSADSYYSYEAAWQPIPPPPFESGSAEPYSMSGSVQSRSRSRFRSISASRPSVYSRTGRSFSSCGQPLGPFAFLQTSPQILWAQHPLSFQFAAILRAYLNRTGYNDGVPKNRRTIVHQASGSRAGYPTGCNGRWNSAHSQGPQRRFSAPQPASPFDMESSGSSPSSMSFYQNMPAKFRQMMLHPAPPTPPIQNRGSFAGSNPIPFRPQRQPLPAEAMMQDGSSASGGSMPAQISGFSGAPSSTPHVFNSDTVPTGSTGSEPATSSASKAGAVPSPTAAGAVPIPTAAGAVPIPTAAGAVPSPTAAGAVPSPTAAGAVPSPTAAGAVPSPTAAGAVPSPTAAGGTQASAQVNGSPAQDSTDGPINGQLLRRALRRSERRAL